MAFPKPVPSLDEEEFARFREELDEFELPEDVENGVLRHMELIEEED
ncbi:hypothetical protein [Halomicrobium urmianum]|nr:hypothetical protein [Halomicrobium urmianum]